MLPFPASPAPKPSGYTMGRWWQAVMSGQRAQTRCVRSGATCPVAHRAGDADPRPCRARDWPGCARRAAGQGSLLLHYLC